MIIAETENKPGGTAEDIIKAVRKAVAEDHDLHVNDIRLTSAGSIPRTTSGKIKRYLCKTNYINGTLKETTSI